MSSLSSTNIMEGNISLKEHTKRSTRK